jgi:hypothetical protein
VGCDSTEFTGGVWTGIADHAGIAQASHPPVPSGKAWHWAADFIYAQQTHGAVIRLLQFAGTREACDVPVRWSCRRLPYLQCGLIEESTTISAIPWSASRREHIDLLFDPSADVEVDL